jgi:hypothetical protein
MIGQSPQPTALYPRLVYGAITLDFNEAATMATPEEARPRAVNLTDDGHAEYLAGPRLEETGVLELFCEQEQALALRWFMRDHGGLGEQFKLWIDRFTGSCWLFEDSLRDQNLLVFTHRVGASASGTATYAAATTGRGVSLSGTQNLAVATAQASAATPTGFDDPLSKAEGVIVLDCKPTWAGNDGVLHRILDTTGPNNRLSIYKTAANNLVLEITDNAGGVKSKSGAVSWAANARVQIVASWDTAGVLRFYLATVSGAFAELTTAAGAGTGLITTLGATLCLGANTDGTEAANGVYDTLMIATKAWADPHLTVASFRPIDRNHYPYAEIVTPTYRPARWFPSRHLYRWPLHVRNGIAA